MKKIFLRIGVILVAIAIVVVSVFFIKGKTYKVQNPIATIQIEGYEKPIKLELDPQAAPNAVANFIRLVNKGYYTNFKMSIESDRILGDESMQMAKLSNIIDNPAEDYVYGIKGDFIANDYDENLIKHQKGVITMERDDYSYFGYTEEGYNSANCNFCILTEDIESYNGYYAAFGRVIEGMDVLEAIASTRVEETEDNENSEGTTDETAENSDTDTTTDETTDEQTTGENEGESTEDSTEEDMTNKIKILSITVDTFGVDYGIPETVNYEENMEKVNQIYNQYTSDDSSTVVAE